MENQNNEASVSKETESRIGRLRNVHSIQKMVRNNVENTTGESDTVDLNTKMFRNQEQWLQRGK